MGKVFKIVGWIVLLIFIYIYFSTVLKSCGSETPSSAADAIANGTEEFIDDTGEAISDASEELFEDEDIGYTDGDEKIEEFESEEEVVEEIIEEETIENTPPPTRYTQSVSSGQYMLIAGNYLVESNANEMRRKLSNLGFGNAEVAIFDNSQYHTVIASRYSDYGRALESSSDLKAKGIDCYVKKRS